MGWSSVCGYALSASDVGSYLSQLEGFRPEESTVRARVEELADAIAASLAEASSGWRA